ncbi:MAG: hypothetical protein CL677_00485 [Bdellovibrionaceae bacterium]|nr:hypothetical protein [Pseudobdellovibrionaceae bacterium]|tara:strand:- start:35448 stop:36347 length:900 start_codon:yes stop_codon:yes gene_type:complete
MRLLYLFVFSISLFGGQWVYGAACCGSGFAAPAIISGDEKALFSTSYAVTEVVIDNVDSDGIWSDQGDGQRLQTLSLEGAHIFNDRWQVGGSTQVLQRTHQGEESSGLGDTKFTLGYEYLTDWDYHPIRPRGTGYFTLTAPTGRSRAESELGGLDSRGNGFWALGLGTMLSKSVIPWDIYLNFEVHKSFAKTVNNTQVDGEIRPGWGGSFSGGAGYNFDKYRVGGSISWNYEDAISIAGSTEYEGAVERYATGTLSASYDMENDWSSSLSYSDQTLFGSPVNTSLGRTLSFQLQKRWAR